MKYLVTEKEADQPITGRTILINHLCTSIDSTICLLNRGIATYLLIYFCRKGKVEYHRNFLTPTTERFLVKLVILKKRRRTFAWHLTPSKQSQKKRKMLLHYRPPDDCMTNNWWWQKKPQINRFIDVTEVGKDIV